MADDGLGELFARAGCQGWLCVADVDGDGEVSTRGDELVVTASVFKVAVALEVFTQAAAGRLDPGPQPDPQRDRRHHHPRRPPLRRRHLHPRL